MDVLANVLTVTNLATHMLGAREFRPPWAISIEGSDHSAVHIVRRGACWLSRPGHEPLRLFRGDTKLLRESREPVARIAAQAGYLSETAFAKAFRRRIGCSPGEYRFRLNAKLNSRDTLVPAQL